MQNRQLNEGFNEIDAVDWQTDEVLHGYWIWKEQMFAGLVNGRFIDNYERNKKKMGKGWRISHEIVRQFDVDAALTKEFTSISPFQSMLCKDGQRDSLRIDWKGSADAFEIQRRNVSLDV